MNTAGLTDAHIAPLVRALSPEDLTIDDVWDRFARVAWSTIAEPGDRQAGELVGAVGALRAWRLVARGAAPEELAEQVDGSASAGAEGRSGERRDPWTQAVQRWQPRLSPQLALRALTQGARFGMRLLVPGDPAWPVQVGDLQAHAPIVLWVRGDADGLGEPAPAIALVGARAATGYGEHVAIEASAGLVDRGFTIVSGGAYGIDSAAHRAALASTGRTLAVLAGGLDRFYPPGNEQLIGRIAERGAVVAEVPPGTAPTRWRFLQRNRLIAALSGATVVVEAGRRSGAINTAGHAGELGRPLGAVPGPVTSAASAGCHRLLRDYDAVCVTNADEMAELVPDAFSAGRAGRAGADETDRRAGSPATESPTTVRVLDALSNRTPRTVQQLAANSGLAPDRVRAELGLLELDGCVTERPDGWVRRARADGR